jgi:hypothetical protein
MARCSTAASFENDPFPERSRVNVDDKLARELLRAAESLPNYDNREFYSTSLQASVLEDVRAARRRFRFTDR